MQNKLQELTEKLYSEGLSKGREEAERIKADAQKEAEQIISKAREESEQIISKAHKEAEDIKERILNEVKMSSRQSYTTLRHEIESLISSNALKGPVSEAMNDNALIKEIIKTIIAAFSPQSDKAAELSIILPEKSKGELEQFITNNITKQFNQGIEIKFDKRVSSGFKIGPKGEGYHISFTDKDFEELIGSYLRPRVREILFEK
ncbi:MAG: V-type ATP synthase subunit E family protein [Bacteroidales bacterium]|nr:V-type ATP synthase subunit E family protein [Bacteroidales bacterium]